MNIQNILTYLFDAIAIVGFTSVFISYLGDSIPIALGQLNLCDITCRPQPDSVIALAVDEFVTLTLEPVVEDPWTMPALNADTDYPGGLPSSDELHALAFLEAQSAIPETLAQSIEVPPIATKPKTLDPYSLTRRQCSTVIRALNKGLPKGERIRQKVNGVDQSTDWMRVQIARHLEGKPQDALIVL